MLTITRLAEFLRDNSNTQPWHPVPNNNDTGKSEIHIHNTCKLMSGISIPTMIEDHDYLSIAIFSHLPSSKPPHPSSILRPHPVIPQHGSQFLPPNPQSSPQDSPSDPPSPPDSDSSSVCSLLGLPQTDSPAPVDQPWVPE